MHRQGSHDNRAYANINKHTFPAVRRHTGHLSGANDALLSTTALSQTNRLTLPEVQALKDLKHLHTDSLTWKWNMAAPWKTTSLYEQVVFHFSCD